MVIRLRKDYKCRPIVPGNSIWNSWDDTLSSVITLSLFQPVELLYKPLTEFQEELLPQDVPLRTIYNIYDEQEQIRLREFSSLCVCVRACMRVCLCVCVHVCCTIMVCVIDVWIHHYM